MLGLKLNHVSKKGYRPPSTDYICQIWSFKSDLVSNISKTFSWFNDKLKMVDEILKYQGTYWGREEMADIFKFIF